MTISPASNLIFGEALIQICDADEELQGVLASCNGPEPALFELLDRIFEDQFLVFILDEFERAKPYLAQCLINEHRKQLPRKMLKVLKWKPGDPGKKYRWMCKAKTCGERCGIHYYPIQKCCSCGGQNLVRQVTTSRLGYVYCEKTYAIHRDNEEENE